MHDSLVDAVVGELPCSLHEKLVVVTGVRPTTVLNFECTCYGVLLTSWKNACRMPRDKRLVSVVSLRTNMSLLPDPKRLEVFSLPRIPEEGTDGLQGVRDGNVGGGLASPYPLLGVTGYKSCMAGNWTRFMRKCTYADVTAILCCLPSASQP